MARSAPQPAEQPQELVVVDDDFTAKMRAAGFLTPLSAGTDFNRLKVTGQNITFNDQLIASYNPVKKEPALYVRIAGPIEEYQTLWIEKDGELARRMERPAIAGSYCRSHFDDPNEARRFGVSQKDKIKASCDECPVHPFVPYDKLPTEAKGKRCSWKGDVDLYILEKQPDGTFTQEDETLYTMSLPTTSMIEFKGSSSKKAGSGIRGSISDENSMVKLAKLGMTKWGEEGLLKAMTYFGLGGVICELRLPPTTGGQDKEFNYNVISFTPIDVLDLEQAPALPDTSSAEGEDAVDDVPF
jgi:hypothetical protein